MTIRTLTLAALLLLAPLARADLADGDFFPPDAGQLAIPAVCNGLADDTDVIDAAVRDSGTLGGGGPQYRIGTLPAGPDSDHPRVCMVRADVWRHGIIQWRSNIPQAPALGGGTLWFNQFQLRGGRMHAGKPTTVIRVMPNQPAMQDPNNPMAVIYTASKHDGNDSVGRRQTGAGVKAFRNGVEDLDVDCGTGNPGCVGIDFLANNTGQIRNVRVINSDRASFAGIRMERYGPGPLMLQNVKVFGFKTCIRTGEWDFTVTAENVLCDKPSGPEGWLNRDLSIAVRKYTFIALRNDQKAMSTSRGMIYLSDSTLTSPAGNSVALGLENAGQYVIRDTAITGYTHSIPGQLISSSPITQFTTHPPQPGAPSPTTFMRLPFPDMPQGGSNPDPNSWANIEDYGGCSGCPAAQNAIAWQLAALSGKPNLYQPTGNWDVDRVVTIPTEVRQIFLMNGDLNFVQRSLCPGHFLIEGENTTLVVANGRITGDPAYPWLIHNGRRKVAIKDVQTAGPASFVITSRGEEIFLENYAGLLHVPAGKTVYARQLDTEGAPYVTVDGKLAVLGYKTEVTQTIGTVNSGGCLEIMGGQAYATSVPVAGTPMFSVTDGAIAATIAETAYLNSFPTVAEITVMGTTTVLPKSLFPARGNGVSVPLLRSGVCQ